MKQTRKYSFEFKQWHAPGLVSLMRMYLVDQPEASTKARWGLDEDSIHGNPNPDAPTLSFRVASSAYVGEVSITYDWGMDGYHIILLVSGKTAFASCGAALVPTLANLLIEAKELSVDAERQMYYAALKNCGNFTVKLNRI